MDDRRDIASLRAQLRTCDRDEEPDRWITVQYALATALVKTGDKRDFELALDALAAAATTAEGAGLKQRWASIKRRIGQLYRERPQGDLNANLNASIAAFTANLAVATREAAPADWAFTQYELARSYARRSEGGVRANLERALEMLNLAEQVYTRKTYTHEWGSVQIARASFLRQSPGDRVANYQRAVDALYDVGTAVDEKKDPLLLAAAYYNLGLILQDLAAEGPEDDQTGTYLDEAERAHREARAIYKKEQQPSDWAMATKELARVWARRGLRNPVNGGVSDANAADLERALALLDEALRVYTPDSYPREHAACLLQKASVRRSLSGERPDAESLRLARRALELWRLDAHPEEIRFGQGLLAEWHLQLGELRDADRALRAAVDAGEYLYGLAYGPERRREEAENNSALFSRLVELALLRDRPDEAFGWSEQGRSRILADRLESTSTQNLGEADPGAGDGRRSPATSSVDVADVWTRTSAWLASQPLRVVVVAYFTLADELVAFVLRREDAQPAVVRLGLTESAIQRCADTFYFEVAESLPDDLEPESWLSEAAQLVVPLLQLLGGADLLYLIPHRLLHFLPLHAVPCGALTLLDLAPVVYAPSVTVARYLSETNISERDREDALVVGNPQRNLPQAGIEAVEVGRQLGVSPVVGPQATRKRVREKIEGRTTVHIAAHGYVDADDPSASGLQLWDGVLTARELSGRRLTARPLVCSSCESAAADINLGEEIVGLGASLLYAGARSTILTYWAVASPQAREFARLFYQALLAGNVSTAEAVRKALLAIRDRQSHTYLWAAFALTGDWR